MKKKPKVSWVDDAGIERDYRDRPILLNPDGEWDIYTRPSTLSGTLKESGGLIGWHGKNVAAGLVMSPSLQVTATDIYEKWGPDPQDRDGKTAWREVTEEAARIAGADQWSEVGTAIHGMIETCHKTGQLPVDTGYDWYLPHAREFFRVVPERYEILESELFVVNDEFGCAGTLDLLLRDRKTGAVMVGDLKTGSHDANYPLAVTCQVALYASAQRYDIETGERTPIHPDLDDLHGILVHLPAKVTPPVCTLYPLNLYHGLDLAHLSVDVREMRNMKRLSPLS